MPVQSQFHHTERIVTKEEKEREIKGEKKEGNERKRKNQKERKERNTLLVVETST